MRTEANTLNSNNMQQQKNHQEELSQDQLHYMSHLSQDHVTPEQHQHAFAHVSSPIKENAISLNEGFYATTPQQHLTSECFSQYYNEASTPSSSSYISSNINSSSDESNGSRPKTLTNQTCKSSKHNASIGVNLRVTGQCNQEGRKSESVCSLPKSPSNQNCKNNKHNASIGVNLRVTGQCSQGGRKYMEDYFSVAYQQSENSKDLEYAFIGIYDGHGGAEAAKFAKEHLMMEIINQRLFWSDNDHDVLRAIREGYIATHYAMWREQDKWPKTANGLPSTAGTTATVAFIKREKIYIGHVGDSGIVLGFQNENENFWRAKQLTIDHKPESVEERTRIINSGGKVVVKSGVPRVVWNRPRNASHRGPIRKKTITDEIPFLAVARSLGDLWSYNSQRNEFVVSPDPDVKVIPINSNTFRCLIFGTDGLWNVVSAQEAVNTVSEKEVINEYFLAQRGGDKPHEGNHLTNPSKSLVDRALHAWSNKKMRADNTSVVTVILYPPGKVDHRTNIGCQESHKTDSNQSAFLQPISYGLEYTQVQAEVPVEDDATTYKEMALKYQPPEAYRNFNYYSEDSDTEGNDNVESEEEEEYNMIPTIKSAPGDLQHNTNYQQPFKIPNNWEDNNNTDLYVNNVQADKNEDSEDNDELEDDDNMNEEETKEKEVVTHKRTVGSVNYQNYVHMEAEETNNATDSYINTFADSYNSTATISSSSLLSSSCNSNSNSNSNCQSVTPPNMNEILQEQQLYQQQCMSEEEGYSLTKLETRREQLTCKSHNSSNNQLSGDTTAAIQTLKIFHGSQGQLLTQDPHQIDLYQTSSAERFYHQPQQEFITKPFELHSLLQQEREEEQQVAYERFQMENKMQEQHQNISDYACLQTSDSITTPLEEDQPSVVVEYLEEEVSVVTEEIITTDNSALLLQDESVQINEISSSSNGDESGLETCSQKDNQGHGAVIENIEILGNHNFENNTEDSSKEIRGGDILKISKYSPLTTMSPTNSCQPCPSPPQITTTAPPAITSTPFKASLNPSKRAKSTFYYNNVPNENHQRISNSKYNHSMYSDKKAARSRKRSMCITPASSTRSSAITPPAASSTPISQRQLRSTTTHCLNGLNATPIMDYGKRTLRTRNSLSKDMKAKSALVQAALKYSPNEATRNFLRTRANNLIVAKPLLLNDLSVTPCKRRSLTTGNNVRTPNRGSIRTRCEKANVAINGSLNQCKANIRNSPLPPQLNLRSRESTSTYSNTSSPTSANLSSLRASAVSKPVIKRVSLTERRILRSMHERSTPSKGSQSVANFSKTTRTQSTGSNLTAPPPSPKLINAVAAVAAATRARSLVNAKHAAAANGSQSVVSAVFGKRTNLRSKATTHPAVIPNTNTTSVVSPNSAHQTLKGRIVKKLKR